MRLRSLAPRSGERVAEGRVRGRLVSESGVVKELDARSLAPRSGERVAEGRVRGCANARQ